MGWVEKAHDCQPPEVIHRSVKLGAFWECDHCRRTWRVSWLRMVDEWFAKARYSLVEYDSYHKFK